MSESDSNPLEEEEEEEGEEGVSLFFLLYFFLNMIKNCNWDTGSLHVAGCFYDTQHIRNVSTSFDMALLLSLVERAHFMLYILVVWHRHSMYVLS